MNGVANWLAGLLFCLRNFLGPAHPAGNCIDPEHPQDTPHNFLGAFTAILVIKSRNISEDAISKSLCERIDSKNLPLIRLQKR